MNSKVNQAVLDTLKSMSEAEFEEFAESADDVEMPTDFIFDDNLNISPSISTSVYVPSSYTTTNMPYPTYTTVPGSILTTSNITTWEYNTTLSPSLVHQILEVLDLLKDEKKLIEKLTSSDKEDRKIGKIIVEYQKKEKE